MTQTKEKVSFVLQPDEPWGLSNWAISWANKLEDGSWGLLYKPCSCRSRIQDYWWKKNKVPEYNWTTKFPSGVVPDSDKTSIYVHFPNLSLEKVESALERLHGAEDEAGISRTQFVLVKNTTTDDAPIPLDGVVFIGDKAWQSALWKQSLYTFLIVQAAHKSVGKSYDNYTSYFLDHRTAFLSKIKDFNEEIVKNGKSYSDIHVNSGFVTIGSGYNKVMAKLLGIKND